MSLTMLFDSPDVQEAPQKNMPTKDEKYNFSLAIENIASQLQTSYIEATTHYCDQTGLEVEMAATLMNESLKAKIKTEAQLLRYLPRSSKLPI